MGALRILALIPTYNEPELLGRCIASLVGQECDVMVCVVNAGDRDAFSGSLTIDGVDEFRGGVYEIPVPADFFWTACMQRGLDFARGIGPDAVLLANADTEFQPGCLARLVAECGEKRIPCAAAYDASGNLIYAGQSSWGFLLFGKIQKLWAKISDAPRDPFPVDLTGGQGVLVPFEAISAVDFDVPQFPQYASDHDLWLTLRPMGYRLWLVPQAAICNLRGFNKQSQRSLMKTLWFRLTSRFAPESVPIMWSLRRKHLNFGLALVSFVVSFGLRWSLGLPKILERSR